jgi:hypothetical protein
MIINILDLASNNNSTWILISSIISLAVGVNFLIKPKRFFMITNIKYFLSPFHYVGGLFSIFNNDLEASKNELDEYQSKRMIRHNNKTYQRSDLISEDKKKRKRYSNALTRKLIPFIRLSGLISIIVNIIIISMILLNII